MQLQLTKKFGDGLNCTENLGIVNDGNDLLAFLVNIFRRTNAFVKVNYLFDGRTITRHITVTQVPSLVKITSPVTITYQNTQGEMEAIQITHIRCAESQRSADAPKSSIRTVSVVIKCGPELERSAMQDSVCDEQTLEAFLAGRFGQSGNIHAWYQDKTDLAIFHGPIESFLQLMKRIPYASIHDNSKQPMEVIHIHRICPV